MEREIEFYSQLSEDLVFYKRVVPGLTQLNKEFQLSQTEKKLDKITRFYRDILSVLLRFEFINQELFIKKYLLEERL